MMHSMQYFSLDTWHIVLHKLSLNDKAVFSVIVLSLFRNEFDRINYMVSMTSVWFKTKETVLLLA